jgi:entericidin A
MNNAIKLLLVLSLSATLLTGCNTARGVGEDIQGWGMRFRVRSAKRLLADLLL